MRTAYCKILVLFLIIFPVFFFAACGEEEIIEQAENSIFSGLKEIDRLEWETGKTGGRFIRAVLSDPKSFNPITAAETSTTDVTDLLFVSTIRRNQLTLEYEPALAEKWEISEDKKTITVYLKKDLLWSDGTPLTAEDCIFTINEIILKRDEEDAFIVQTNQRDNYYVGDVLAEFELVDRFSYKVVLPHVTARMFDVATIFPVPVHLFKPLIEEKDTAAVNSFWGVDADVTAIVGCGPFIISEYLPSQKIVLKKNPFYWERDEEGTLLPYLDEVVYLIAEDMDTQLAMFLSGKTDGYALRGEDYTVLMERKDELGIEIYNVGPNAGSEFITFNQNPVEGEDDSGITPPQLTWLSNKKFRQAMAHLIDRKTIIDNVAYGFGYPQYSPVWMQSPYYWEGAPDAALRFDPEEAKRLLDEAGYMDRDGDGWREDSEGNRISLILNTNSGNRIREAIGEIFCQEAAKVGIEIVFKPIDFNTMVTKLNSSYDWEMILIGLTGGPDPGEGSNVYPSRGSLHMIEPGQEMPRREWEIRVDDAWDIANLTIDEEQRKKGFVEFQKIWIEEVPWVYTYCAAVMHSYKTIFGNIKPHPMNAYGMKNILSRMYLKD